MRMLHSALLTVNLLCLSPVCGYVRNMFQTDSTEIAHCTSCTSTMPHSEDTTMRLSRTGYGNLRTTLQNARNGRQFLELVLALVWSWPPELWTLRRTVYLTHTSVSTCYSVWLLYCNNVSTSRLLYRLPLFLYFSTDVSFHFAISE